MLGIALTSLMIGLSAAADAGVRASMSQKGIDYVREIAIPQLVKSFQDFSLPDVPFDKLSFKGTVSGIHCQGLSIGGSTLKSHGSGVQAGMSGVGLSCSAHWDYKEKVWPHYPRGSGSVDVTLKNTGVSLQVGVTESEGKPHLSASDVSASVDLDLHFHGGITAAILNLIKSLFHHTINSSIQKELVEQIGQFVNVNGNEALAHLDMSSPLTLKAPFNISEVRFDLAENPTFNADYIGVSLLGDIVNQDPNARHTPPFSPPAVPSYTNASDHYLQLVMSPYLLESGIWTFYDAGLLSYVVDPHSVPPSLPFQLNTTWLSIAAPELKKKYPNMWVQLEVKALGPARINADSGVRMTVPVGLEFEPLTSQGPADAFTLGCNFSSELTFGVDDTGGAQTIHANMSYLRCDLELVESQVGDVHFKDLGILVRFVLSDVITPLVNVALNAGIPLPSMDRIDLTDSVLTSGPGYLVVASNFVYHPPDTVHKLRPLHTPYFPSQEESSRRALRH